MGDVPPEALGLGVLILIVSAAALAFPGELATAIHDACVLVIGERNPPARPLGPFAPFVLHVLVHQTWAHLAVTLAMLVAFGAGAARRLSSPPLFVALFVAGAVAAALAEAVIPREAPLSVFGASSGVLSLVAAASYPAYEDGGLPSPASPHVLRALSPWIVLISVWAVFTAALGSASTAWVGQLAGLATGVLLFPVLANYARR